MEKTIKTTEYGPPCAMLNFSKLGYRYFRVLCNIERQYYNEVSQKMATLPNVNWVVGAKGVWNFGVGILASDLQEVSDSLLALKRIVADKGTVLDINEAVNIWLFPNHPIKSDDMKLELVEPNVVVPELSRVEWDYLKIISFNSDIPPAEMALVLNISPQEIKKIHASLVDRGIIVCERKRFNFVKNYYKAQVDVSSVVNDESLLKCKEKLFNNPNVIYAVECLGKHNFEVEFYADNKRQAEDMLKGFSDYVLAEDLKFWHQVPFPVGKTANLLELKEALLQGNDKVVNLLNSKLWYLNPTAVVNYINLDSEKDYAKTMVKKDNCDMQEVASHYLAQFPNRQINVVDWGSGSGKVGRQFNETLGTKNIKAYYPIDIQPVELYSVVETHKNMPYTTKPIVLDFEKIEARFPLNLPANECELHVFLGGTYGNFEARTINSHIQKVLADKHNRMIVQTPVFNTDKQKGEAVKSYAGRSLSDFCMGMLGQFGFKQSDFIDNPSAEQGGKLFAKLEEGCVRTSVILANSIKILGKTFNKGTEFKLTSTRKMSAAEFRESLEQDFNIDFFVNTDSNAIALISAKR